MRSLLDTLLLRKYNQNTKKYKKNKKWLFHMFLCKHICMPFCAHRREFAFPSLVVLAHNSCQCLWPVSLISSVCSTLSSLSAKAKPLGKISKKIKVKCQSFLFPETNESFIYTTKLVVQVLLENNVLINQSRKKKISRSCKGSSEQI